MIVTLTANPSVDRTIALDGPLARGALHRAAAATSEPAGKGVNVARAVAAAGRPALAVVTSDLDDPFALALAEHGVAHHAVPLHGRVRVNTALTEPDGTTTKVNEPGQPATPALLTATADAVVARCAGASWVVLSGSVPPGTPTTFYADLVARARASGARVAVDTSGPALVATAGAAVPPDLLKPNAEELAEITGADAAALEADPSAAAAAAAELVARGVGAVLLTLGGAGAVLACAEGTWLATGPPLAVRSTVGAGDCTLAGYLLADLDGAGPAERLRRAVAHGRGAVLLPGSAVPSPAEVTPDVVGTVDVVPLPADSTAPVPS